MTLKARTIDTYRVDRAVLDFVEFELGQYEPRKAQLQLLESELAESEPHRAPGARFSLQDLAAQVRTTQVRRRIAFLKGFCEMVDTVMAALPDHVQTVVKRCCMTESARIMEVAADLYMDRVTLANYRDRGLLAFAMAMFDEGRFEYIPPKNTGGGLVVSGDRLEFSRSPRRKAQPTG